MTKKRCLAVAGVLAVLVCVGLVLAPVLLPEFTRTVVESVFGEAKVMGTSHIKTPIEKIHHWLAPPILREGT